MGAANTAALLLDDIPGKMGTPKEGVWITMVLNSVGAFANLANKEFAPVVNKVVAVWCTLNTAIGVIFPDKFKEAWGLSSASTLGSLFTTNLIFSVATMTALMVQLAFLEVDPMKAIGYTFIPFALNCFYNIFNSDAKDFLTGNSRAVFFAIMAVLTAGTLL